MRNRESTCTACFNVACIRQDPELAVHLGLEFGPVLAEQVEECRVVATLRVRECLESRLKIPPEPIQGRFVRVALSTKFRSVLLERLHHGVAYPIVFA